MSEFPARQAWLDVVRGVGVLALGLLVVVPNPVAWLLGPPVVAVALGGGLGLAVRERGTVATVRLALVRGLLLLALGMAVQLCLPSTPQPLSALGIAVAVVGLLALLLATRPRIVIALSFVVWMFSGADNQLAPWLHNDQGWSAPVVLGLGADTVIDTIVWVLLGLVAAHFLGRERAQEPRVLGLFAGAFVGAGAGLLVGTTMHNGMTVPFGPTEVAAAAFLGLAVCWASAALHRGAPGASGLTWPLAVLGRWWLTFWLVNLLVVAGLRGAGLGTVVLVAVSLLVMGGIAWVGRDRAHGPLEWLLRLPVSGGSR